MKGRPILISVLALGLMLALAAGLTLAQGPGPQGDAGIQAAPVSTSFTYQGRLNDDGSAANGDYDFQFKLYDGATAGGQVGSTVSKGDVAVSDGLFTVELDFGSGVFTGDARWLEIGVRSGASTGAYTALTPRQELTATPYALYALTAGAHGHWGETWSGSGVGLTLNSSNEDGLRVSGGDDGIQVESATDDGVLVVSAGEDGVQVESAGRDGVLVLAAGRDGLSVAAAVGDGLWVNTSGDDGVEVGSAGDDGFRVQSAGDDGFQVQSASDDGFQVQSAGDDGVHVGEVNYDGVYVYHAHDDGFDVYWADDDGVHVGGAGDDGVYVESANGKGVYVKSASWDGVYVESADRHGVLVLNAGGWAGYFNGDVRITGTCSGCAIADFGRNAGQTVLEPGDVVAVRGVTQTDLHGTPVVMEVDLATGRDAAIGVVAGRAELDKKEVDIEIEGEAEIIERLVPREGPAQPGEYVNIIIYGLAQVKASATTAPIEPGTRLTAADSPGHARAVQTVEVQGVRVAESASIVGLALEKLESGQGLIWVLVNPH